MSRQSLAALRRTVEVQWKGQSQEQARDLLVRTARAGHAETMQRQRARAGFAPDFDVYVNRPGNENLPAVKLPGPIVYRYRYLREIVEYALGELYRASPVQSGRYVQSHTVFVNGQPVEALPDPLPPSAEVMIANPVPYARRLEIGKTKAGRDFVLQVEPRIYERVAKGALRRRFGKNAEIEFTYVTLPGSIRAKGALASHYRTGEGRMRKRNQRKDVVRTPAIIIRAI